MSTTIAGSGPYLDHSYVVDGRYLPESDVFSFGVTLLETVTGTRCGLGWTVDAVGPKIINK